MNAGKVNPPDLRLATAVYDFGATLGSADHWLPDSESGVPPRWPGKQVIRSGFRVLAARFSDIRQALSSDLPEGEKFTARFSWNDVPRYGGSKERLLSRNRDRSWACLSGNAGSLDTSASNPH